MERIWCLHFLCADCIYLQWEARERAAAVQAEVAGECANPGECHWLLSSWECCSCWAHGTSEPRCKCLWCQFVNFRNHHFLWAYIIHEYLSAWRAQKSLWIRSCNYVVLPHGILYIKHDIFCLYGKFLADINEIRMFRNRLHFFPVTTLANKIYIPA